MMQFDRLMTEQRMISRVLPGDEQDPGSPGSGQPFPGRTGVHPKNNARYLISYFNLLRGDSPFVTKVLSPRKPSLKRHDHSHRVQRKDRVYTQMSEVQSPPG
jgi:hypothetical protein